MNADCRFRLGKIAPMSQARAIEWPKAIQQTDVNFDASLHCSIHIRREHHIREGAVCIPVFFESQQTSRDFYLKSQFCGAA